MMRRTTTFGVVSALAVSMLFAAAGTAAAGGRRHATRITMSLVGALDAVGTVRVPDGTASCRRRVVDVQTANRSSWSTVETTRSSGSGVYFVGMPDTRGDYRAVARVKRANGEVCERDVSAVRSYEGPPSPKPLDAGLLRAFAMPPSDWRDIVGGWAPVVYWRDVQPTRNGRLDTSRIDELIRRSREAGLTLRIRFFAGFAAPTWVKREFGSVTIRDPYDGITATVPKWWKPGYMRAYELLQARLAAKYDGNPTLRAVTVSGAMTIHAEPFIRGMASSLTRQNLLAAGYTPRADKRAIRASIGAQAVWQQTRQVLAFNPWQYIKPDGRPGQDVTFANQMMDRFRSVFGKRAILQNNSIRSSWITGSMGTNYTKMIAHMVSLGGPIAFQTAREDRVGNVPTVLQWCVDKGAFAVELHDPFGGDLTKRQARHFDTLLEANA